MADSGRTDNRPQFGGANIDPAALVYKDDGV